MARAGRPRGEITLALLAAAKIGPCTVRELADRSQVGRLAARYKAAKLLRMGALVVVQSGRPRKLGLPSNDEPGAELASVLAGWR